MKSLKQFLQERSELNSNEVLNRFAKASVFSDIKNMIAFPDPQSRDSWIILRAKNGKVSTFAFYPNEEYDDFEEFEMRSLDDLYNLGNEQLISSFLSKHKITDVGVSD